MKHKYTFGYSRKFAEKWDAMKKRRECEKKKDGFIIGAGEPSEEDERCADGVSKMLADLKNFKATFNFKI